MEIILSIHLVYFFSFHLIVNLLLYYVVQLDSAEMFHREFRTNDKAIYAFAYTQTRAHKSHTHIYPSLT